MPAIGTDQNPPVRVILYGLLRLQQYLDNADFEMYLNRLANCDKHFAFLAELDPILRAKEIASLDYEPRPQGPSEAGPDWRIDFRDGSSCLLEVKCRIKQLIKLLDDWLLGRDSSPHASRMEVPEGLFADTERKFGSISTTGSGLIQGIWTLSPVQFIESQVRESFASLDSKKIQALVFGRSWREYEVFARTKEELTWFDLHFSLPK